MDRGIYFCIPHDLGRKTLHGTGLILIILFSSIMENRVQKLVVQTEPEPDQSNHILMKPGTSQFLKRISDL